MPAISHRNVLIISVGATPPVVTETVWKLFQLQPVFVPHRIHLVTTAKGNEEFVKAGLLGPDGKLAELFAASGHAYVEPEVNIPQGKDKAGIADIRTEAENVAYGNEITRLVRDYAQDSSTRIHMSLAGGRKIMSWYAGAALSLFGRPRDQLSHVLVTPEILEACNDFWWPGQPQKRVPHKWKKNAKGEPQEYSIEGADVIMPLIPFVRLTPVLGKRVDNLFPGGEIDYEKIVKAVQDSLNARQVTLVLNRRAVRIGSEEAQLDNLHFALYCLLADARKNRWPGPGLGGDGADRTGWLTYEQIFSEEMAEKLLDYYAETFENEGGRQDYLAALIRCAVYGECDSPLLKKDGIENAEQAGEKLQKRLEPVKSKINTALENQIKNPDLCNRLLVDWTKHGARGKSVFGLLIDPADIVFDYGLNTDA